MKKRFSSLRVAVVVASIFLAANPGISAETGAPASAASPASSQAPEAALPPRIDPRAEQLLSRSCEDLGSSEAVSGSTYYNPYFDGSQVAYTVAQV